MDHLQHEDLIYQYFTYVVAKLIIDHDRLKRMQQAKIRLDLYRKDLQKHPLLKANDDLYIPLNFWFNRNVELSIPSISLKYGNIQIENSQISGFPPEIRNKYLKDKSMSIHKKSKKR